MAIPAVLRPGLRVSQAADRLFELRQALDRATARGAAAGRRVRRAERRARAALSRAGFADLVIATEVLGHVQVLTMTATLAGLDYATPHAARTALSNLLAASPAAPPADGVAADGVTGEGVNGSCAMTRQHGSVAEVTAPASAHPASAAGGVPAPAGWLRLTPVDRAAPADGTFPAGRTVGGNGAVRDGDEALVRAAHRVVAAARLEGAGLSQTALAGRLRAEGYRIANERLRWLAAVTGLSNGEAREHR